jgi:plastocyanin
MKAIKSLSSIVLGAALALAGSAYSAHAVTANVTVSPGGALSFSPATANINVGDTVLWTWSGSGHSTTSGPVSGGSGQPNGLWDSSVVNAPHTFSHTFTTSGTFPYYCTPHASFGMTGSVIVSAPAVPPVVTITNPVNGVTLSAPASLNLVTTNQDGNGGVTNVQFLEETTTATNVLGNVKTAPFSFTASGLAAGNYTFAAIASDGVGLKATNSVAVKVINASTVTLGTTAFSSPQRFQFSYNADAGLSYVVLTSTNLSSGWTAVVTNVAVASPVSFTNLNATGAGAFYRVERLPNP